jgi:hypothetical protein
VVQGGLVGLDDQQVGGVLVGDQPVGVLTLGVHGVGGQHPAGQVQAVQERLEPGDLVGLGVHVALAEDRAGGVVHRGEQVDLLLAVVAAAAEGLAVDGDRLPRRVGWWRWLLAGQPGADGAVQRVGVDAGQHAAHGSLAWWPEGVGPRVAADPECGQHRGQGVASAAPVAGSAISAR